MNFISRLGIWIRRKVYYKYCSSAIKYIIWVKLRMIFKFKCKVRLLELEKLKVSSLIRVDRLTVWFKKSQHRLWLVWLVFATAKIFLREIYPNFYLNREIRFAAKISGFTVYSFIYNNTLLIFAFGSFLYLRNLLFDLYQVNVLLLE